jgi:hypothetical protein
MSAKSQNRRLSVESLESRAMLAGNVIVSVTDNMLRIVGDAAANDIEIQQVQQTFEGEWPGVKLRIIGHDTTINGQSDSLVVEGVKNSFVGLQGGNNQLVVGNTSKIVSPPKPVNLPGRVHIGTWAGDDSIKLNINNSRSVTINQGPGSDYVFMARSNVRDLTINVLFHPL